MRFEHFGIRKNPETGEHQETISVHPLNVAFVRDHGGGQQNQCVLVFTGGAERRLDIPREEAVRRLHAAMSEGPPELVDPDPPHTTTDETLATAAAAMSEQPPAKTAAKTPKAPPKAA